MKAPELDATRRSARRRCGVGASNSRREAKQRADVSVGHGQPSQALMRSASTSVEMP